MYANLLPSPHASLVGPLPCDHHSRKSHPPQPVEAAWQQARELAEGNIARGDEMADCANQIAIIQSSEYQPAETAFRDLHARQKAVLDKLAPRVRHRFCFSCRGVGFVFLVGGFAQMCERSGRVEWACRASSRMFSSGVHTLGSKVTLDPCPACKGEGCHCPPQTPMHTTNLASFFRCYWSGSPPRLRRQRRRRMPWWQGSLAGI